MKTINASKKNLETDLLLGEFASSSDCKIQIKEDCEVLIDGEVSLIYFSDISQELKEFGTLKKKLRQFDKWTTATRNSSRKALKSTSKIFGYQPRSGLRNRPCNVASLAYDDPELSSLLTGMALDVSGFYMNACSEIFGYHFKLVDEKIPEQYTIKNTPFTSGIVNRSGRLPYHFDAGNIKGCWSAMLGISDGISGGDLCIPEIDCRLKISDGSLCLFNGQGLIHGVSKFNRVDPNAERYTIVWYSLQQLWKCLTREEEIKRINESQKKSIKKKAQNAKGVQARDK